MSVSTKTRSRSSPNWTVFTGRVLPATFREQCTPIEVRTLLDQSIPKASRKDDDWIYTFEYLRGLDGRLPGDPANQTGDSSSKEEKKQTPGARPNGHDQTDYLLRIAEVIKAENQRLRDKGKRGFRAIGVLGSDVYDKLLILRALRPEFPGVLFLPTTWTRNLRSPRSGRRRTTWWSFRPGVATRYPRWQGSIPPFRDGYQTAFYLGTLIALDQLNKGEKAKLSKLT